MRNRIFANQDSVNKPLLGGKTTGGGRPLYFVNSSVGLVPSNPNTLRDMGGTRNCEYHFEDKMEMQEEYGGSPGKVAW